MEKKAQVLPVGAWSASSAYALDLRGEQLLGQLFFAQQDAPEFDPLHPGEGAALVAGAFHQRRNAEPFQLLLDLRGVEDHGVLNGEAAIGG